MQETIFPRGIIFNKPKEGAPSFIRGKLSFKVDEAVGFLREYQNEQGWVNIDIKQSKEGKLYLSLNTFNTKRPIKKDLNQVPF